MRAQKRAVLLHQWKPRRFLQAASARRVDSVRRRRRLSSVLLSLMARFDFLVTPPIFSYNL
jgi:hypothetical protein